eukprot:maker-scaffold_8-snap-gene-14.18-mRNA-1 protein AED:0.00 eAED:0.00 QI:86/1/1/1/1/1/2/118/256
MSVVQLHNTRTNAMNYLDQTKTSPRKSKFRSSIASSKKTVAGEEIYGACIVPLPEDDETEISESGVEDWIAENMLDLVEDLRKTYSFMAHYNREWEEALKHPEVLNNSGYPRKTIYLWKLKGQEKPVQLRVDSYIEAVFEWIDKQFRNEEAFPLDYNESYPSWFISRFCKKIFQRAFRIFAIIFSNPLLSKMYEGERRDQQQKFFEGLFKRFMYFCWYWDLLKESECECILEYVNPLKEEYFQDKKKFEEMQKSME